MHLLHNWKKVGSSHQICSDCGKCQTRIIQSDDQGDKRVWVDCTIEQLQYEVNKEKKEIEEKRIQKEQEKARQEESKKKALRFLKELK